MVTDDWDLSTKRFADIKRGGGCENEIMGEEEEEEEKDSKGEKKLDKHSQKENVINIQNT